MALSPQTVPPAPMGLPPPQRTVRSLRIVPILTVVLLLAAAFAAIGWWAMTSLSEEHVRKAESGNPVNGQGASFTDLLAGAPSGTEISARAKPVQRVAAQPTPPPKPAATTPPAAPPAVDDNDTDAAIAARRQAWQTYYQQVQQAQQARFQRQQAALSSPTVDSTPAASTAGTGAGVGPGAHLGSTDFFSTVASNPVTDYLPFTLTDPISPYEIKAGDAIPAHLVSGLDSDSPGAVVAVVSKNVYDYATGTNILVPQGSRLFGTYATGGSYGQTRTMVAWTRIIYPGPCSQSLDLGAFAGADETGQGGFSDITENHYGKIFLNAFLVSMFSAGVQLSQPSQSAFQAYSPVQNAAGSVGQTMGQLGSEFARRGMDIPPTQRIRQGYNFVVLSLKDIAFSAPWVEGVCKTPHARPVVM